MNDGKIMGESWRIVLVGSWLLRLVNGYIQWVDLRQNLQETIDFPMKYGLFL